MTDKLNEKFYGPFETLEYLESLSLSLIETPETFPEIYPTL